ncbi:hypothetical protein RF11_11932 [Thelohanellus kitauei]|uniref:Uncharacterized protein n=1 Tax=Thelohanellus kitauei TaxID=669202 RepID=A0A0C2MG36_THEKT|nr:hypothetical protein RF11_11932 [Thelohanellus kitauei]
MLPVPIFNDEEFLTIDNNLPCYDNHEDNEDLIVEGIKSKHEKFEDDEDDESPVPVTDQEAKKCMPCYSVNLCRKEMKGNPECESEVYFDDLRENIKNCLGDLFEMISIAPYFKHVVSLINESPLDYTRIESCLLFISSMIESSVFPDHFIEIMDLIPIPFGSIYKWLATVPKTASKLIDFKRHDDDYDDDGTCDDLLSDFYFLSNILVFCRDIKEVEMLAKLIKKLLAPPPPGLKMRRSLSLKIL